MPTPAAHRRKAAGDGEGPAHPPLLVVQGHPGPAQGAGELLRPPLRREAQPRHAGRRDAGLQGRLRQHGLGHHRAGRCGAGAQPDLSDPRLRLHHVAAASSARCRPSRTRISCARSIAPCGTRSPSRSRWSSTTRPTRPPTRRRSISTKRSSPTARSTSIFILVRSRLFRDLFRRRSAALGARSAGRHRHHRRVHLDVARPIRCPAGASASPSATSG